MDLYRSLLVANKRHNMCGIPIDGLLAVRTISDSQVIVVQKGCFLDVVRFAPAERLDFYMK